MTNGTKHLEFTQIPRQIRHYVTTLQSVINLIGADTPNVCRCQLTGNAANASRSNYPTPFEGAIRICRFLLVIGNNLCLSDRHSEELY